MFCLKPVEHAVMSLAWIASIRHICENPFIVLAVAPPCRQQQSLQGIEDDRCARRSCRTAQNGRVVTLRNRLRAIVIAVSTVPYSNLRGEWERTKTGGARHFALIYR